MASDPPLAFALRELRAALYTNAMRALSADRVGPSADLSRLDLGEADVGEALATALRGAKATSRVDLRGKSGGGILRLLIFAYSPRTYHACFCLIASLTPPARSCQATPRWATAACGPSPLPPRAPPCLSWS